MATGDHDWTAGEQVTAANMDDYLQLQVVQQFATAAARDSALSARKREGMVTYQLDTNTLTVYSGAAWSTVGPAHGALLTWTPVVIQGATPTLTVQNASYVRIGRMIIGNFAVTITSNGTAANNVTLTLPVTAAASQAQIGMGYFIDSSTGFFYSLGLNPDTTKIFFEDTAVAGVASTALLLGTGANTFSGAVASGDTLAGSFHYMAAADA